MQVLLTSKEKAIQNNNDMGIWCKCLDITGCCVVQEAPSGTVQLSGIVATTCKCAYRLTHIEMAHSRSTSRLQFSCQPLVIRYLCLPLLIFRKCDWRQQSVITTQVYSILV